MIIRIRCQKCGGGLKTDSANAGKMGECPKCKATFLIPEAPAQEKRQAERAMVQDKDGHVEPDLKVKTESVLRRFLVQYTEADPSSFTLKRPDRVPLLDISEGGIRFMVKDSPNAPKLKTSERLIVYLDFPILDAPVPLKAQVRWVSAMEGTDLYQVGVQFEKIDDPARELLKRLITYVILRE